MSSLVLDLQKDLLQSDCNILNALRKSHLIASKLKLSDFDTWIMSELNGYSSGDIPDYRLVKGNLKAKNPINGWIPVVFGDNKTERSFCEKKLPNSISEIIELSKMPSEETVFIHFSAEETKKVIRMSNMPMPMPVVLVISPHQLKDIVEKVKNCILEWTIKLELEGILGDDMTFDNKEAVLARSIPQHIHNYYGNVVNGDVHNSQVISGRGNNLTVNSSDASTVVDEIRKSIIDESIEQTDKDDAIELLEEISTKIEQNKNPSVIKSALMGLIDFTQNVGANITAALISAKIQGLF